MTIEKQMTRQDLVALIGERERKERIRNAAEELLEACKAGHNLLHEHHATKEHRPLICLVCDQMEAAIAKAEGSEVTT